MAGLKKPTTRRDPNNPNKVLVIFLVFFVLLSIGLGFAFYSGLSTQAKLKEDATKAKADKDAAKLGEDFGRFLAQDARLAITGSLDADDMQSWKTAAADAVADGGRFKAIDEKSRTALKKMIDDNKANLGAKADGGYANNYQAKLKELAGKLNSAEAAFAKADGGLQEEKKRLDGLKAGYDAFYKTALAKIDKGNKDALEAATANSTQIVEAFKRNAELQKEVEQANTKSQEEKDKLGREINALNQKLAKAVKDVANASQGFISRSNVEPHALLLDVSRGKSLWDTPIGKIVKVNLQSREVVINVGSALGVKPETTFNVFAAGDKNQAEGLFKGTVEVIRVLGPNTSMARITSLYDATGSEIMLNDPVKGRISREADNPFKEGDLLFNMAFGTRVAIAGLVNWSGYTTDTAAEQMRNLNEFMHTLRRQGVRIDAYLDLTDAKLKGALTEKTRYLIIGPGAAPGTDGKLSEEGKKLNAAIQAARADAIEKGIFIISDVNFANVIGYRQPRSANDLERLGDISRDFRPAAPGAAIAAPPPNP